MLLSFARLCAVIASALLFSWIGGAFAQATSAPHHTSPILPAAATDAANVFTVYKSPTCGCCAAWVDHLGAHGIGSQIEHPADLNAIKERYQIALRYQSCHTAVSPEGYVFEGHIPADVIQRFLKEKPADARGLAVPGMPLGSPGMEMGDQFTPYDVYLLKQDGSVAVYAHIKSAADQRGGQ